MVNLKNIPFYFLALLFFLITCISLGSEISVERTKLLSGVSVHWLHMPNSPTASFIVHVPSGASFIESMPGINLFANLAIHDAQPQKMTDAKTIIGEFSRRSNGKYFSGVKPGRSGYQWHDLKPEFLPEAIDLTLNLVTQIKFEPAVLDKVRETMKLKHQNAKASDFSSALAAMTTELLPKGSPASNFSFTAGDIAHVGHEDLVSLVDEIYNPKSLELIIAGDLNVLSRQNIEQQLNLHFSNTIDTSIKPKKKITTTLTQSKDRSAPKNHWIETPGTERHLRIGFELASQFRGEHPGDYQLLLNLINADVPGALSDILKQKGWITKIHADAHHRVSDYTLTMVDLELTSAGASNREGIVKVIFGYLHKLKQRGLKANEKEWLSSYFNFPIGVALRNETGGFNPTSGQLADFYVENLDIISEPDKFLDVQKYFKDFSDENLKATVDSMFDPKYTYVSYVGPEVIGQKINSKIERSTVILEKQGLISQWQLAISSGTHQVPIVTESISLDVCRDTLSRSREDR